MDSTSVGDFAEQLMRGERKESSPPPVVPFIRGEDPEYIQEKPLDISQIEVPTNFLEAVNENKEVELPKPVIEDKAELAEANPLAGQAVDIMIAGLGKMLETVRNTLNEVKEFVNENSLVNELTSVGDLGANMAPAEKKKKVAAPDKEATRKKDRVQAILAQVKKKKRVAK
tara:strand:+ start:144 stop:656 length:513 start_codon:yes stop_codon:yes gene_type:complete